MRRLALLSLSMVVCLAANGRAQDIPVSRDQRYLLLATTRTSTMQGELNAAAALGFRIVAASPTRGDELVVLLERVAQLSHVYVYRLLATTTTSTMERELIAAGADGFRFVPQSALAKQKPLAKNAREIVVIMERAPESQKRYTYRLLATSRTTTMQSEIAVTAADGYSVVGILSRNEHIVLMEREVAGW